MKKAINITSESIQAFMCSLERGLSDRWQWNGIENEDMSSLGFPETFYYHLSYQKNRGESYDYCFWCKPLENLCTLAQIQRVQSNDGIDDTTYNELVDKVYTDVLVPHTNSGEVVITFDLEE